MIHLPAQGRALFLIPSLLQKCNGGPVLNFFAAKPLPFDYTVEMMARRKRAGLFPAYVHSPRAHGPGSTRRFVRRGLAGLFCSCGVDSDTQASTTDAISGQLSTRSKTSCAHSSWCNSGHEQSFLRRCARTAMTRCLVRHRSTATHFSRVSYLLSVRANRRRLCCTVSAEAAAA